MELFELFESYETGVLSKKDSDAFEERLASDAEFKSEYLAHQQMQSAFDVLVAEDVRSTISNIENPSSRSDTIPDSSQVKGKSRNLTRFIISAAALLVGAFAVNALFFNQGALDLEPEYFVEYKEETDRGDSNEINIFKTYGKDINALVKSKQWEAAAEKLKALMTVTAGSNKDETEWNLACVTSEFDKPEAIRILKKILADPDHDFYNFENKARDLLKELEK